MTLHPLVPLTALLVLGIPLLVLTVVLAVRATRSGSATGRAQARSWWLRSAVVVLLVAIGLGPSVPSKTTETSEAAVDVFLVVDLTGSMAAEDFNGTETRLSGAKADILGVVDAIPGARFSIIAFDSQSTRQLPLTSDPKAVQSWVETTDREVTTRSRGSLVDRPLNDLSRALSSSAEQRPANVRLVYFFTDGENTAKGQRASFSALVPFVDGGAVLGYGTTDGGKMKTLFLDADGRLAEGGYIKDTTQPDTPDGLSKMNPSELSAIASELGVDYVHRTAPSPMSEVVGEIDAEMIASDGRRSVTSYQLVLWPFALALAALLSVELWGIGRRLGQKVGV